MPKFNALMDQLRKAGRVDPTDRLREAIEAGLIESNAHSDNEKFLTIPFLLLGILYVGKHSPLQNDFITEFYRQFGPDETEILKNRVHAFNKLDHYSTAMDNGQLIELPWISPDCLESLKLQQGPIDEVLAKSTPENFILNLLENRPEECRNLFEQSIDPWETLSQATKLALQKMKRVQPIKDRLAKIVGTALFEENLQLTKLPARSVDEWRDYLSFRYEKKFSESAIRTIIVAFQTAATHQNYIGNLITVNSKNLLSALADGPLNSLTLGNTIGVYAETPPWYEPQSDYDDSEITRSVFGITIPSVELESIISTAAALTDTTKGFPIVTEWHLAFAAISSKAMGIVWQLRKQNSSTKDAAIVLRKNMTNQEPDLAFRLDWSLVDKDERFSPPEIAEETSRGAGTKFDYSRDSTQDEIDDVTNKLARAIASTFKSSNNKEFCFALFGPWGRGKTTLIRQVSKELEEDFVSVTFNAWKYPSRPEVWVWLYETIKQKAYSQSFWNGLKLGVQCKLRQDNGLPLIFPALVLLFSAFSKWTIFSKVIPIPPALLEPRVSSIFTGQFWAMILDVVFAVVSIIIIWLYGKKLWSGFGVTLSNYMQLPNHGRHLGLQATIGDDLKRLVSTWTATNPNSSEADENVEELPEGRFNHAVKLAKIHWGFMIGFILLELSLLVLLLRIWSQAPPILLWLTVAVLGLTAIIFFFLLGPVKRAKKVLLVVDDLDRCPPDEMLTVIESLRVFLEDRTIEKNLKIAMLLDRDILSHAICSKYKKLIQKDISSIKPTNLLKKPPARLTDRGIVAEQIEKYFILSFDLPPLASESAYSIASKIVGYTAQSNESAIESSDHPDHDSIADEESTTPHHDATFESIEPDASKPSVQKANSAGSPVEAAPVEEVHLTGAEQKAMVELLHSLLVTDPAHATPRRMRMIKMRYFLARQILREQGIPFNPEELLKHFSGHYIHRKLEPKLAEVVGMVTGKITEL